MQFLLETYRFFKKHLGYSLINLGGLALGLAVFLLLQLFISQQRNYDTFWNDYEDIYRLGTEWTEENDLVHYATAPPPLAPFLNEYEEVEAVTRLVNWSHFTLRPDNDSTRVFRETNVYIADDQFFNVFQGRLIAGTAEALNEPGNIVLSETALKKYFGPVEPEEMIGRLVLGGKDAGTLWKITGIFRDMPHTSHMDFEIMVSMWDEFTENDIWTWNVMHTYVRSKSPDLHGILGKAVDEKVIPYLLKQGAISSRQEASAYAFIAEPITEVHLKTGYRDAMEPGIRADYLQIMSGVAILVIFLACFNYMNISTALSYARIRNVGIMKIHGASQWSLFGRYMGEYLLQTLVALCLSVGIMELTLLFINKAYPVQLSVAGLLSPHMLVIMAVLVVLCTLLSGFYPTWRLLRGKPTSLIRGESRNGAPVLRNTLIIGQFAISLFLIACTFTLHRQLTYMQHYEPGFDRENVLVIQNDREIEESRQAFVESLVNLPDVTDASFTTGLPALSRYQIRDVKVMGTDRQAPLTWYEADEHYVSTMKIRMTEGNGLVKGRDGQALVNESAVRMLGLENPVGAQVVINEGENDEHLVTIRGVMEDFQQRGFREQTEPLIIEYLDNFIFRDFVAIRYSGGDVSGVLNSIKETWMAFEPEVPMNYYFFDTSFDDLYRSEQILNQLFILFSVLALVIALIGLLGMVAITSRQRMREIGIRKVLGASSTEIVHLMLRQFSLLVIIACAVALPLSWFISGSWLNEFVLRTELNLMPFLLTGLITFFLSSMIVIILSWRSSRINPVKVIRKDT